MAAIDGPDFITLVVSNLERSYAFYKDKLKLPESSEQQPNAHAFHTRPCGLAIRQSTGGPASNNNPGQGVIIWLHTPDAPGLYAEMKEKGIPIVEELHKSPFGMIFSFRDPDGYVLSVHDGG